jgi:mRNA interferase MazF
MFSCLLLCFLPRDSVANVTGLVTLDKSDLSGKVGKLPLGLMNAVDRASRAL